MDLRAELLYRGSQCEWMRAQGKTRGRRQEYTQDRYGNRHLDKRKSALHVAVSARAGRRIGLNFYVTLEKQLSTLRKLDYDIPFVRHHRLYG